MAHYHKSFNSRLLDPKRQKMVEIGNDTIKLSTAHYNPEHSERHNQKLDVSMIHKFYQNSCHDSQQSDSKAKIVVKNMDTLVLTEELVAQGHYPLVLNLASSFKPGGGFLSGAMAQEEELFRRTNYYMFLNSDNQRLFYPLSPNEVILTNRVMIIKDQNYTPLGDKSFMADFLAVAAPKNPGLNANGSYSDKEIYQAFRERIESIFQLAILNGNKYLVLGSLGCGAYRNPPEVVVKIFEKMIKKYSTNFDGIYFGVLSWGNNQNYNIFKVLEKLN